MSNGLLTGSNAVESQQQYRLFPLPVVGLVGLKSGVEEPVLGHKKGGNVSLVVNDYYFESMIFKIFRIYLIFL